MKKILALPDQISIVVVQLKVSWRPCHDNLALRLDQTVISCAPVTHRRLDWLLFNPYL